MRLIKSSGHHPILPVTIQEIDDDLNRQTLTAYNKGDLVRFLNDYWVIKRGGTMHNRFGETILLHLWIVYG